MLESPDNVLYRVLSLERTIGKIQGASNMQAEIIQQLQETPKKIIIPGQTNLVRNGDFDLDRNRYIYTTDYTGSGGVDADVSEEAAYWFVAAPDTAVETTGSIASGATALTIDTPSFVAGDASKEIVVEGAGASGADLITTISGAPGSTTTATLAAAAGTSVTNARVRWRLRALTEDSTDMDADASQTTNTALKTFNHSRYNNAGIINDPDYNKADGWARTGAINWLCAPMPKNYFKPSTTYIITFIYRLRTAIGGADSLQIMPFAGLWDNSAGRRQFLEGKPVDVAATVIGTPAATVSREYFIVFYTNWGEKIGSKKVTVALAPSDTSFITNSVYVNLAWTQPLGTIRTEIYRKTGAVYKLVGLPYPQSDFRDNNAPGAKSPITTVTSYPPVDYSRPLAMIKTTDRNFAPARVGIWQFAQLAVNAPFDYDVSKLTDKQWLVLGLQANTGAARSIEIDKISVDDKYGQFSLCSLDEAAKRGLSSSPVSGNQGNPGGTIIPPGETNCPTFEMPVWVEDAAGVRLEVEAISLVNNRDGYKILNRANEAVEFAARVSPAPQSIFTLYAENGKCLRASEFHPCFENDSDTRGKSLREMIFGDTILCKDGEALKVLSNLREVRREYTVEFTLKGEEKGFWINGFGGHNVKNQV